MCELLISKDEVKLRILNNELKFLKKEVNSAMKEGCDCQLSFPRSSEQLCMEKNDKLVLIEYKQTKRALWLARAERAKASWNMWRVRYHYNPVQALQELTKAIMDKWENVERKCREKAEEYR